jgi:molybdopterin converting factor subunit 1
MNVSVRLFAGLRDAVGARVLSLELPAGATVVDLKQRLGDDYPAIREMLDKAACAMADEYVARDERLRDGAEVALIPPVSGG